jgi:hypothetical protein
MAKQQAINAMLDPVDQLIRSLAISEGPLPQAAREMLRFKEFGDPKPSKETQDMIVRAMIDLTTKRLKRDARGFLLIPEHHQTRARKGATEGKTATARRP